MTHLESVRVRARAAQRHRTRWGDVSDEVDCDDTEVKNRARSGLNEKGVKRRATSHFTELCCRCRKAVMIQTHGFLSSCRFPPGEELWRTKAFFSNCGLGGLISC